jgi:hypothetical protein
MVKRIINWVVESEEEVKLYFDPNDQNDTSLYDFILSNSDRLNVVLGSYKQEAHVVSSWVKKHLSSKYPGSHWVILDYHSSRLSSWHEMILRQVLSDEDLALSGDIMNAEGRLIKLAISSYKGREHLNYERPTTMTFIGI